MPKCRSVCNVSFVSPRSSFALQLRGIFDCFYRAILAISVPDIRFARRAPIGNRISSVRYRRPPAENRRLDLQSRAPWQPARPALFELTSFRDTRPINPLLGRTKTLQAGDACGQIDVLPFWIEAGCLQLIRPTEKFVDKARNTMIARRARAPVERGENHGHRDGGDPLALGDQVRIVRWLQIRGEIVIPRISNRIRRPGI
jgi:hypothetical protein